MKFKNKTFLSIAFIFVFLILIEIIFRLINGNIIFNISFLRVVLQSLFISGLLGYLTSLFNQKINYILNIIIAFICSLYGYLQLGFYNFIGVYMSVNSSSQLGAVKSYVIDFLKSCKIEYYIMFVPFIITIIMYVILLKTKKYNNFFILKSKRRYDGVLLLIHVLILLTVSASGFYYMLDNEFTDDKYQAVSVKNLFYTGSNPNLCVKEFGILPFSIIDFHSKFVQTPETDLSNFQEEIVYENKYDDTAWLGVIENETNKTYNNLNNYFITSEVTDSNEQTGLFKDKNVIVIMMESVNDIIYNKEYFPNFSFLADNGWYFNNNYSPRNSCATGNNEFSAMTGLFSIYNMCTSNIYVNNTYFTSIFNLFNNKGYYTNSFHNYSEMYYYRTIIHPNMGSQKYYSVFDMPVEYDPTYGTWIDDNELMKFYLEKLDELDKGTKFMSFLTTVTSHQPYSSSSIYGDMYLDMTKDSGYSMDLRRYLSKLKVLDNSLGLLIEGLKERKLYDNTVIVLFGDHYPYGLSIDTLSEILDRPLDNYENEKVPLVIFNSKLKPMVNDTYTSYLNLTPTLANLFGLDFDSRLYSGSDIFNEKYDNMVVFPDSSWKNDLAYYNANTGKITYFTDFTYEEDEIMKINKEIYAKINSSMLAIKNNYFSYLENALNNYNERNTNL